MTQEALLRWLGLARRLWRWIAVPVVAGMVIGAVLAVRSDVQRYRATTVMYAQAQLPSVGSVSSQQAEDPEPFLRGQAQLALSSDALSRAAGSLGGGSVASLRSAVSVRVDGEAKTLEVSAVGSGPAVAGRTSNAVARALSDMALEELSARLQVRAEELQRQVDRMSATVDDLNGQLETARRAGRDATTLEARRATAQSQYASLVSSQQELLNAVALQRAPIALLEPATTAQALGSASPVIRSLIGGLLGLLVGVVLLATRRFLDDTIRWVDQAEFIAKAPLLAELPEEQLARPTSIAVLDQPTGALAESFRGLRTALKFVGQGTGLRSVAVISSQPGDGKTLTAANLAVSYAQAGTKVVLVSGDLRNPTLDAFFEVGGEVGFSDLLAPMGLDGTVVRVEPAEVLGVLQHTIVMNLRVLPSGTLAQWPSELLAGPRAAQVMEVLHGLCDLVIVDSPPLLVADPEIIGSLVDGILLVVSLNRTRVRRLRRVAGRLSGTRLRLIGVVVNRTARTAGYYGRYGYGSQRPTEPPADQGAGDGRRSARPDATQGVRQDAR